MFKPTQLSNLLTQDDVVAVRASINTTQGILAGRISALADSPRQAAFYISDIGRWAMASLLLLVTGQVSGGPSFVPTAIVPAASCSFEPVIDALNLTHSAVCDQLALQSNSARQIRYLSLIAQWSSINLALTYEMPEAAQGAGGAMQAG